MQNSSSAALPKRRAEVVFADQEFHICMRWQTDEATLQIDLTGSRRFLCVEVTNVIDRSPIDYDQVSAGVQQNADADCPAHTYPIWQRLLGEAGLMPQRREIFSKKEHQRLARAMKT